MSVYVVRVLECQAETQWIQVYVCVVCESKKHIIIIVMIEPHDETRDG